MQVIKFKKLPKLRQNTNDLTLTFNLIIINNESTKGTQLAETGKRKKNVARKTRF